MIIQASATARAGSRRAGTALLNLRERQRHFLILQPDIVAASRQLGLSNEALAGLELWRGPAMTTCSAVA